MHYLLIEQALEQLVAGGWGVFVVPRGMFEAPEAKTITASDPSKGLFARPTQFTTATIYQ